MRIKWTDELIVERLRSISIDGVMPTVSYMNELHMNDIACAVSRRGGVDCCALMAGLKKSDKKDTGTGYAGEEATIKLLQGRGFVCTRAKSIKSPYDIIVNDSVRADVKTASYAEYGASKGWFFRIGKEPSCDVVILYRSDIDDCFIIPYYSCTGTNLTLNKTYNKYRYYWNNFDLLTDLIANRKTEKSFHGDKFYHKNILIG